MLAKIYRPQQAAVIRLTSGEEVNIGFVVESGTKRMVNIFAVERGAGDWLAVDVRKIPALGNLFAGVGGSERNRLQVVGEALSTAFASRADLAWALAGIANEFAPVGASAN